MTDYEILKSVLERYGLLKSYHGLTPNKNELFVQDDGGVDRSIQFYFDPQTGVLQNVGSY